MFFDWFNTKEATVIGLKLANEFKWRLLELGHPKDLVEKLNL